jgi:hypothetical protein
MSPVLRYNLTYLDGVKGHLNAFEREAEDLSSYTSIAFNPNKYGAKSWSRGESLLKMKKYVSNYITLPDKKSSFIDMIKGKKVAIVGNGNVDKDYSSEIDSADIVIRINNFYNYNSNKVGKRTDIVVLSGLAALCDQFPGNTCKPDEVIFKFKPHLFILSETSNQRFDKIHSRYNGCNFEMLYNEATDLKYTTGTIILKMIANLPDTDIKLYGFNTGDNWKSYIAGYGIHHSFTCKEDEELILRQKLINKITNI